MSWKALSCGFAFWITLASLGNAATITLDPSLENTLVQTSGTAQLSNALGNVYVGRTNQAAGVSIRRGLIEFDIADNIPSDATITGGTLAMTDVQGLNGNQTLTLHDTLQSWGQGTSNGSGNGAAATNGDATWLYTFYNASNPSASTKWATPGGSYSPTVSGSALDVATGSAGYLVLWESGSNPQMTADIQNWLSDPATNFGWTLLGNESQSQTTKALYGMYSSSQPLLTVSYAVPEPPAAWLAISGLFAVAVVKGRRFGNRLLSCLARPGLARSAAIKEGPNRS
jgi:hypothetical protein